MFSPHLSRLRSRQAVPRRKESVPKLQFFRPTGNKQQQQLVTEIPANGLVPVPLREEAREVSTVNSPGWRCQPCGVIPSPAAPASPAHLLRELQNVGRERTSALQGLLMGWARGREDLRPHPPSPNVFREPEPPSPSARTHKAPFDAP